jgi:prophage regulatory protein
MSEGNFPLPVSLGGRAVGWIESEIDDWLEMRVAERRGIISAPPDPRGRLLDA